MQELKTMCDIHKQIREVDEDIAAIREQIESPKSQVYSDMPKGEAFGNAIENALIKIEKLERKREFLCTRLVSEWLKCERLFNSCNISEQQIKLMEYRYLQGLSWNNCVRLIAAKYPHELWNANKAYRIHKRVIAICTENRVNVC